MNKRQLVELLRDKRLVEERLKFYLSNKLLFKANPEESLIEGHLKKASHNLSFVSDTDDIYPDWIITGCYYAVYHAALALLIKRGYFSKNHDATLCVLIKEYYQKVEEKDLEIINKLFLTYRDLMTYVHSKNKREDASYSTSYIFDLKEIKKLKGDSIKLINKIRAILES